MDAFFTMSNNEEGIFSMADPEELLAQIDHLLDQLISIAEQLKESSKRALLEQEMEPLQKKQDELLEQLLDADAAFKQACRGDFHRYKSPKRARINEKLEYFQKLNAKFIDNLQSSHGLIQFEIHRISKLKDMQ